MSLTLISVDYVESFGLYKSLLRHHDFRTRVYLCALFDSLQIS